MRSYEAAIAASELTDVTAAFTGGVVDPSAFPIASPWSSSDLNRIVANDVFGPHLPVNTRAAAMRIPAIARARNLLVSSIARHRLVAATIDGPVAANPAWMSRASGGQSPQHRMAWTIDDHIFYGWSCWYRANGADGFPLDAQRVNQGEWSVNSDNRVEINGAVMSDEQVILIPGFHEGILTFGVDALGDARRLYEIVRDRLNSPVPPIDLHQTGGTALTEIEIDNLIDRWVVARREGKAVGFTSEYIEVNVLQSDDAQLMIEARNAAALDLARLIGITAGLIDATAPKASLNYETATGRNEEFVDRDLFLYTTPIAARLSMDDVLPRGQHAAFDFGDFTAPAPSPTGPPQED